MQDQVNVPITKPKAEIISPGPHSAVIYSIIPLGIQVEYFKGVKNQRPKVIIGFEVDENINNSQSEYDGMPMFTFKKYTYSFYEKSNLYKDLVKFSHNKYDVENKEYELSNELGTPLLIEIVHREGNDGITRAIIKDMRIFPDAGFDKLSPVRKAYQVPDWIWRIRAEARNYAELDKFTGELGEDPLSPDND